MADEQAAGREQAKSGGRPPLVVGIGASAGGLGPLRVVLGRISPPSGIAILVLQHHDAQHESHLVEILQRSTGLTVCAAVDDSSPVADHVHVVPPGQSARLQEGRVRLTPTADEESPRAPIDHLFTSMAESLGPEAVGVILSGSGSDGTRGCLALRSLGAVTIAQTADSAGFASMPDSAARAGGADFVLDPKEIATLLVRLSRHSGPPPTEAEPAEPAVRTAGDETALERIFETVTNVHALDFSRYKRTTMLRRIVRRMVLHGLDSLEDYADLVEGNSRECEALFTGMLIHLTSFFREEEAFDALVKVALPDLLADRRPAAPLRAWVAGCSSGEEVYSLAMRLTEALEEVDRPQPITIFATDVDSEVLARAREGIYSADAIRTISPERLHRFFVSTETGYQVKKSIRELCVFARHDVTSDPPFSRLDLVLCRNLLIYLRSTAQARVIPLFHFALNPGGFLLLGSSESVGRFSDLFALLDGKNMLYRRKATTARLPPDFGQPRLRPTEDGLLVRGRTPPQTCEDPQSEADRLVLSRYGPCGVIVDPRLEIVQFRGHTGRYLEPSPGEAAFHLLRMARPVLLPGLREAIAEAQTRGRPSVHRGVMLESEEGSHLVDVEVVPLRRADADGPFLLVLFETRSTGSAREGELPSPDQGDEPPDTVDVPDGAKGGDGADGRVASDEARRLIRLREELDTTRETLRALVEEYEAGSEELRAAYEEIQSSNEELRSTNEELETTKEELQSVNEELVTLNEELETRNAELALAADDLNNVLDSIDIPVVILGPDLVIRSFTRLAAEALRLRPGDEGRPIEELSLGIDMPDLGQLVRKALESLRPVDREVPSRSGSAWYSIRLRPYRTSDDRIDGCVLALVDITERRRAEAERTEAHRLAQGVVDTVRECLLILDSDLRVITASRSFYRTFRVEPTDTRGLLVDEIAVGRWNAPTLRGLLERVLPEGEEFEGLRAKVELEDGTPRTVEISGRRVRGAASEGERILLTLRLEPKGGPG